jgi:hypothetical protein
MAGFNETATVSRDFSLFAENLLSVHVAKQIAQMLLEHNLDVWLYTDRDWFIRDLHACRVAREQATGQVPPTVINALEDTIDHVVKIVGVSQQHDVAARCERYVREVAI